MIVLKKIFRNLQSVSNRAEKNVQQNTDNRTKNTFKYTMYHKNKRQQKCMLQCERFAVQRINNPNIIKYVKDLKLRTKCGLLWLRG